RDLHRVALGELVSGQGASPIRPAQTDSDGWFMLNGLGRERVAELAVNGPGIETMILHARSRRGETIKVGDDPLETPLGEPTLYPARSPRAAGPSVAVQGSVVDGATGLPLAGILVRGQKVSTNAVLNSTVAIAVRSITDAEGRYRLEGLPLGRSSYLAIPPQG